MHICRLHYKLIKLKKNMNRGSHPCFDTMGPWDQFMPSGVFNGPLLASPPPSHPLDPLPPPLYSSITDEGKAPEASMALWEPSWPSSGHRRHLHQPPFHFLPFPSLPHSFLSLFLSNCRLRSDTRVYQPMPLAWNPIPSQQILLPIITKTSSVLKKNFRFIICHYKIPLSERLILVHKKCTHKHPVI